MEEFGREVSYPTLDQIIEVNRRMIETSGGSFTPPDNLRYRDSLEYILDAIARPVFDHYLFDSLKEKASALTYEIIKTHPFIDGNKRTGIHIAWEFLRSNDVPIYLDSTVVDIAVSLAEGTITRNDFLEWLHNHQ